MKENKSHLDNIKTPCSCVFEKNINGKKILVKECDKCLRSNVVKVRFVMVPIAKFKNETQVNLYEPYLPKDISESIKD